MKLSEIEVGKEYAVTHHFTSTVGNKDLLDITKVTRHDVDKATVESKDKYNYAKGGSLTVIKEELTVAPKSAKVNIGILVSFTRQGEKHYTVVRISNVLHEWNHLEPLWLAKEEEERKLRAIAEQQELELRKKRDNARLHAERAQVNLPSTLKKLLGGHLYGNVTINYSSYSTEPNAEVTLTLKDMERLIERAFDNESEEVA
jgi:hypothetical protein